MTTIRHLAYLALILMISGCTQGTPYRTERDTPPNARGVIEPVVPAPDNASEQECIGKHRCLNVIEFDEFGNAESRSQFNNGLADAKRAAENDGVVVVYLHGWHHNAKLNDTDITSFKTLLAGVRKDRQVAGIYVGWRGESIRSDTVLGYIPSYLVTFWGRKDTAHDIGNAGAVGELIRTLSDIRSHSKESRLLIIGHSFGGAMLYSAMSDTVAEQIRRDCQRSVDFTPIADLVILVNPAIEAMRLRPLYSFARGFEYPSEQQPRLFIITTKADFPTRVAFKAGRHLGTLFKSYPNGTYKEQDVTAIGHYRRYITHQMTAVTSCSTPAADFSLTSNTGAEPKKTCIAGQLELTRCDTRGDCEDVADDHYIERGTAGTHIPHRFPIYNIRTTAEVIPNHTDIWGDPMQKLMLELIGEVQKAPHKSDNKDGGPTNCGTPTGQLLPAI